MDELGRNLNSTMLSSHGIDEDKTRAIDDMQQRVMLLIFGLM